MWTSGHWLLATGNRPATRSEKPAAKVLMPETIIDVVLFQMLHFLRLGENFYAPALLYNIFEQLLKNFMKAY
jgi:hypothetical protein